MSHAQQGELALALLISLIGGAAILCGLWVAVWRIYDTVMGHFKRRRNNKMRRVERSPYSVGRDAFRFTKGTHYR